MPESMVLQTLTRLAHRGQRLRLVNRLVSYALSMACGYLVLLILVLLLDLGPLPFHLAVYTGFSLLPLFLVTGSERAHALRLLRDLDDHCQVEACLSTSSPEHRAVLDPRCLTLLEQRVRSRLPRFRLSRHNRVLALAGLLLAGAFELCSLAVLGDATPRLSAAALREQGSRRDAARQASDADSGQAPVAWQGAVSEQQARAEREALPGGVAGQGEPPGDGTQAERGGGTQAGGRRIPPGGEALTGVDPAEGANAGGEPTVRIEPRQGGSLGEALQGALERAPGTSVGSGPSPGDTGEAGRALRDSPLRDYSAREDTERIQATGDERMTAGSRSRDAGSPREYLRPGAELEVPPIGGGGFDPGMQDVGRRYVELMDERY